MTQERKYGCRFVLFETQLEFQFGLTLSKNIYPFISFFFFLIVDNFKRYVWNGNNISKQHLCSYMTQFLLPLRDAHCPISTSWSNTGSFQISIFSWTLCDFCVWPLRLESIFYSPWLSQKNLHWFQSHVY